MCTHEKCQILDYLNSFIRNIQYTVLKVGLLKPLAILFLKNQMQIQAG